MTIIAIDFGTSRTKLAYRNARGEPRLLRFERDEFAPSVFYLPRGSDAILWGDEAAVRVDDDPAGVVEVLKRKLRDPRIRANQRSEPPSRLLAHMLADLRARTAEIAASSGTAATAVTLTLPAIYGPIEEKLLREAATAAGFTQVDVVAEPVAAARAWLTETGERADEVVVFDAGGGTLDWAFLRRGGDDFRVVPDCPPGGDARVGGYDVDQELLEIIRERLAADSGPVEALDERPAHWRGELRRIKERFGRGGGMPTLRIDGRAVGLSEADVRQAIEQRFIEQACVGLGAYLEKVREHTRGRTPPVLLVGGSARTAGLREALEHRLTCRTHRWDQSDYATVLGGLSKLGAPIPDPRPKPEPAPEPAFTDLSVFRDSDAPWCPEMVVIPAGSYVMGSPPDEERRNANEGPQHRVTIGKQFAIGKYAVTFAEYDHFCEVTKQEKPADEGWGRGQRPVINVSWQDAKAYVDWLSRDIGQPYRLPSEAEWEYACRAGTTTPFSFGRTISPSQANYNGNSVYGNSSKGIYRKRTVAVGSLPASPWGLHEMHGNVWEWVEDIWHDNHAGADETTQTEEEGPDSDCFRVVRGGCWKYNPWTCRSAFRFEAPLIYSVSWLGFRLARTLS